MTFYAPCAYASANHPPAHRFSPQWSPPRFFSPHPLDIGCAGDAIVNVQLRSITAAPFNRTDNGQSVGCPMHEFSPWHPFESGGTCGTAWKGQEPRAGGCCLLVNVVSTVCDGLTACQLPFDLSALLCRSLAAWHAGGTGIGGHGSTSRSLVTLPHGTWRG